MQIISAKRATDDALLRGTGLWRSSYLSQEERRALEGAVMSPRPVNAHIDVVREGERTDNLFLIIEGWACRFMTTREGGRQFSALLVPGDICDLGSLLFDRLDGGIRTLTPAKVVALPRGSAMALAAHHSGIARTFTRLTLVENAILGKLALALSRRSAKQRLAHLLCELSVRVGMEQEDERSFDFPLTQEQIGDAIGLTSVHVNRTVRLLRAEGLIAIANRTMTLRSVGKLRQIGGFDPRYLHMERDVAEAATRDPYPKSPVSHAVSFSQLGA